MRSTFDFISDPGHGWVKVPLSMLRELGIDEQISPFSYMRGANAYLEEDCDAGLFMRAYKQKFGVTPKFRERVCRTRQSKIRSYYAYQPIYYTNGSEADAN